METLHKAPEVFERCAYFSEAADWLIWQLTGEKVYGSCMAGYKACWNAETRYPDNSFWEQLDPRLANIVGTKVGTNVQGTGTKAGCVNAVGAELTGLKEGTVVSVPVIDAHAALPAVGITEGEKLLLILGTSGAHIIMHEEQKEVAGISGSVKGGIIPELIAYESGQASVGDCFEWFVKNCVPESYQKEAKDRGINIYQYLTEKASLLDVGSSGLLALDWFNGNRAPYVDFDLTGVILGLNLRTKPEEIFRALIESTAFGTKRIVDIYEKNGINVREIYASGGISQKNAFLMQIYADVLGQEIKVIEASQAAAQGSAVLASVASGYFDSFQEATKTLCKYNEIIYTPNQSNTEKYDKLYKEYLTVSEFFAKNSILKNLKLQSDQ
jgi:L-ribulokinase